MHDLGKNRGNSIYKGFLYHQCRVLQFREHRKAKSVQCPAGWATELARGVLLRTEKNLIRRYYYNYPPSHFFCLFLHLKIQKKFSPFRRKKDKKLRREGEAWLNLAVWNGLTDNSFYKMNKGGEGIDKCWNAFIHIFVE